MSRALATIALLILSNTFMTLAWYGHIAFKSKIERFGMLSIILLSWGIALFEYCFQWLLLMLSLECATHLHINWVHITTFHTELLMPFLSLM